MGKGYVIWYIERKEPVLVRLTYVSNQGISEV